ncbi:MAG: hypothetical protein P9X27_00005, partial [Candidatus Kaelpia aquatica]|nr:hypothetical protein [Candidatus Kaelpia aquatica]
MKRMTNLIILALLVSLPLRAQASAFISGNHGLDIEQSFDTSSIGTGAPNTMLQLPLQEIVPLDIAVVNSCIIDLGSIVDGSITPEIINNAIGGIDTILANPEGFRATVSKDQYNRLLSSLEKMNEQNYNVDMLNKIYSDIGDTLKRLRNKAIDLQDQLLNSFEDFKVAESSLEDTSEEDIITATNEDLELFAVADEKERIAILRRMEDRMEDCYDDSAINRTILMGLKAGLIGEISILEERGIVINVTTAAAGADLTAQETLAVIKGVIDYYEEKDNSSSIVVASNTDSQVEVESSYDALAGSNMEERALGADGLTATVFGVQVQGIIAGEVDLENLDNNVVVALQEGWGLIGEAARAAITDEAAVFSTDRTMVVYEDSGQIEIDNINNGVEFFGLMGGAPAQYAVIGTNDLSSLDSQNQELALLVEAGQVPIEFVGVIKGNTENYDIPDSHYALFG